MLGDGAKGLRFVVSAKAVAVLAALAAAALVEAETVGECGLGTRLLLLGVCLLGVRAAMAEEVKAGMVEE